METEDSKKKKLKQQQQLHHDDDETQDCSCSSSCYIPECIISHILSFLPTEDRVRASFVSKTWKPLLFPLSLIDLDFERFSKNSPLNDQKKRFAQFVQCIMLLHNKGRRHLKELRLAFDISGFEEDHPPQIDEWVSFAMTSDSVTLDLDFWGGREGKDYPDDDDRYYCLPESTLRRLQSVEVLRLKYCIFIPSLDVIFMSIKILILTAVSLPDESVHVLIESCPCLEELHLIACIVPECFFLNDLETKLKFLVFDSCKGRDLCLFVFTVDIPSLLRFKYVGGTSTDIRIGNSRNLSEAEIKIDDDDDYDFSATEEEAAYHDARLCGMLHEVLSNIDNVDSLTISKSWLQMIIEDLDTKLKCFEFDSCKGHDRWLFTFVIHIPSLLRLKYVGDITTDFHIENSGNLTEADIKFVDEYYDPFATEEEDAHNASRFCTMIHELLSDMYNIDTLTISQSFLKVLTFEFDKTLEALIAGDKSHEKLPPSLPKLKHLSLISYDGCNFMLNFACLLKSSPNLETLCIDQSRDELIDTDLNAYLFDHEKFWRTYLFPPEFFRNLKKVEIKGFEGRNEETLLLKIILDHSLVLEEMVIYKAAMKSRYASMKRDGNQKKAVKLLKPNQKAAIDKLLSFRRGSSRARILLL